MRVKRIPLERLDVAPDERSRSLSSRVSFSTSTPESFPPPTFSRTLPRRPPPSSPSPPTREPPPRSTSRHTSEDASLPEEPTRWSSSGTSTRTRTRPARGRCPSSRAEISESYVLHPTSFFLPLDRSLTLPPSRLTGKGLLRPLLARHPPHPRRCRIQGQAPGLGPRVQRWCPKGVRPAAEEGRKGAEGG